MEIDLNILFQKPELDKKVILTILPLAPLSMVSDIPGTYYKSQEIPDKYKLCGLFENIMGWHFGKNDREAIAKKVKEFHIKKLKDNEFQVKESNSGFKPLLYDFFEIDLVVKRETILYNDLWKKSFSRMDADTHAKGTPNLDYQILRLKQRSLQEEDLKSFFGRNKTNYPMYYTSPTLREYVIYDGIIEIALKINHELAELLKNTTNQNSMAYLGNSEGWVELNIN